MFVLTHYEREPLPMAGGTTFRFVTDGLDSAMAQAREAAGDRNVSITGGVTTVNQCLAAGMIDELRLHVVPHVAGLGKGPRLFDDVGHIRLEPIGTRVTPLVTHHRYRIG